MIRHRVNGDGGGGGAETESDSGRQQQCLGAKLALCVSRCTLNTGNSQTVSIVLSLHTVHSTLELNTDFVGARKLIVMQMTMISDR